jgi:hypothetical protein
MAVPTTTRTMIFTSGATPTITTNSIHIGPIGAVGAPTYSFTGQTNYGMYATAGFLRFAAGGADFLVHQATSGNFTLAAGVLVAWGSSGVTTPDLFLRRAAAATLQLGAADVNGAPVPQALQVQNAITGTDLAAAAQFRIVGPLGTGAGATSPVVIAVGGKQATGTTAHAKTDLEEVARRNGRRSHRKMRSAI